MSQRDHITRIDDTMNFETSCRKFLSLIPSYDELKGENCTINCYNYYHDSLNGYNSHNIDDKSIFQMDNDTSSSLMTSGSVSLMFHQINRPLDVSQYISSSFSCVKSHSSCLLNKLLMKNYGEYLKDASQVIHELTVDCSYWANKYDSQHVIESLNYSSSKHSLTNDSSQCKYYANDRKDRKDVTLTREDGTNGEEEDDYAMHGSASPPPTVESPSSSSETTCTDSGVFVNLTSHCNLVNQHIENSFSSRGSNCDATATNHDTISCANHEQPIQLSFANKINDEPSNVPLIASSPQPLISNSSNCSTIILSSFATSTRVTLDKCKKENVTLIEEETSRTNCSSDTCYARNSCTINTVSTDESSSCVNSDVTLMLHHRQSNNCSPVTSVEELNSMAHESCAVSGTGSTNGQITYENSIGDANEAALGPFICALLNKLECMVDTDLVTNLQLTGIISHLCSYPIPLLRSFFLSSYITYSRDIKSFHDSLIITRNRIIDETSKLCNFDTVLCASRCYLMSRDESFIKSLGNSLNTHHLNQCISDIHLMNRYNIDLNESFSSDCASLSTRSSISSTSSGKRKSLKEFLFRPRASSKLSDSQSSCNSENDPFHCQVHPHHVQLDHSSNANKKSRSTKVTKRPLLESLDTGTGYRFINRSSIDSTVSKDSSDSTYKSFGTDRDERVMLAALVFEEFLKEISAICHEHSISSSTVTLPLDSFLP